VWQRLDPTTDWKTMPTSMTKDTVQVATDFYYINVAK
jgi:hypothetical protein